VLVPIFGAEDDGALRMAGNYAAVAVAWRYLYEFAGMDHAEGNFIHALFAEMKVTSPKPAPTASRGYGFWKRCCPSPGAAPAYGCCDVSQMSAVLDRTIRIVVLANGKVEGLLRVESARTPVANLHVKAGSAILWRFRMPRQINGELHETE
jgi:hypothetical protein